MPDPAWLGIDWRKISSFLTQGIINNLPTPNSNQLFALQNIPYKMHKYKLALLLKHPVMQDAEISNRGFAKLAGAQQT